MNSAPEIVGNAQVICFAIINAQIQPTGNNKQIVGGVLQGPASGLAICKYEHTSGFYLFGCDENWRSVTDTWHETLEDAKDQAEFEYEGVSKFWQTVG